MSDFMITRRGISGGVERPELTVTAPTGSTVVCTKGTKTVNATESGGTWLFKLPEYGLWTVTAAKSGLSASATVNVEQDYTAQLSYYKIYGISRDTTASSPAWTRTDDAVGKSATASVGTVAGSSDFDDCYPWSGIVRENIGSDVMVKIPKFYFRRYKEGNIEHIKLADRAAPGFTVHPAFNHGGVEKDYLYVGAYKYCSGATSVSGATPQGNNRRPTMRTNAQGKGSGWGIIDISALSAIQMLILVEFANNNVQAVIGRGYCDGNTARLTTGSCDSVPNLTGRPSGTDGKTDVVWRGIEGLWGNVWEWLDGVNWYDGTYYVCNDPSDYADDTGADYTAIPFTGNTGWNASFITEEGVDVGDNSHVILPVAATGGSESTYQCDTCRGASGWRFARYGGSFDFGSASGLFTITFQSSNTTAGEEIGSRLIYIPQ